MYTNFFFDDDDDDDDIEIHIGLGIGQGCFFFISIIIKVQWYHTGARRELMPDGDVCQEYVFIDKQLTCV